MAKPVWCSGNHIIIIVASDCGMHGQFFSLGGLHNMRWGWGDFCEHWGWGWDWVMVCNHTTWTLVERLKNLWVGLMCHWMGELAAHLCMLRGLFQMGAEIPLSSRAIEACKSGFSPRGACTTWGEEEVIFLKIGGGGGGESETEWCWCINHTTWT